jgi:hypothetical protein
MKFRKIARLIAVLMMASALMLIAGCLYPDDQTPGSNVSARESVLTVQDAVDRYKEQTGLLPMQNAGASVPVYEKYKIDFGKLKRMNFLANIPPIAFENGGDYQFLIIDEESKPAVKLLDLGVFQAVADVQDQVDEYRAAHAGNNPSAEEVYPGFSTVDFYRLPKSAPVIRSMYSQQSLNLLVNDRGQVVVDYGIDILTAVNKSKAAPGAGQDLRRKLIEASYFVPVKSPVYHWVSEAPQAVNG